MQHSLRRARSHCGTSTAIGLQTSWALDRTIEAIERSRLSRFTGVGYTPMATRRVMRSVLHNFLGTFTSRNSDHRGYWLFGPLLPGLEWLTVDLLGDPSDGEVATEVVRRVAIRRFSEQMLKLGLDRSCVRKAELVLTRDSQLVPGCHGDFESLGHEVSFAARVVMDNNHVYERHQSAFVAAHDPSKERRRDPTYWDV